MVRRQGQPFYKLTTRRALSDLSKHSLNRDVTMSDMIDMISGGLLRSLVLIHPKRQLREMYLFLMFFSFATALVTVFEPIFFYQLGIPIWLISIYYLVHYFLYVLLMPIGGMFAARFGYERSLALAAPVFVGYFLLLAILPSQPELLWIAALVLTCFKIFYWPAYHANFASYTDGSNRGTEQSWAWFVQYGAGILGPLVGGIVAQWYGFSALFVVTAGLVLLAGMSLLRTRERYTGVSLAYTDAWHIFVSSRNWRMVWAMIGWGENYIYLVIWPLFLFFMLKSVGVVGIVASFSAAVATVGGFVVGEVCDRITPRRLLKLAVPYMSLGYVWRALMVWPWAVVVGDVMMRTSVIGIEIPLFAQLYKDAKRIGALQYAIAFETILSLIKIVVAAIVAALFFFLPVSTAFIFAFALAGLLALFYNLI